MSCFHKLGNGISRAHGFCAYKIKYYIGRALSQVNHILSICAQKGVSSDIFHEELMEKVILATHAAWKTMHTVHKTLC